MSLLLAVLLLIPGLAIAEAGFHNTAEVKSAELAGTYLGFMEYVRVFKESNCAYALPHKFPRFEEILEQEILPAFPPAHRHKIQLRIAALRATLLRKAQQHVAAMITAAQKDLDGKTGCGVVAGMLAALGSQAFERWKSAKTELLKEQKQDGR